jgi:hypothetical protein
MSCFAASLIAMIQFFHTINRLIPQQNKEREVHVFHVSTPTRLDFLHSHLLHSLNSYCNKMALVAALSAWDEPSTSSTGAKRYQDISDVCATICKNPVRAPC